MSHPVEFCNPSNLRSKPHNSADARRHGVRRRRGRRRHGGLCHRRQGRIPQFEGETQQMMIDPSSPSAAFGARLGLGLFGLTKEYFANFKKQV